MHVHIDTCVEAGEHTLDSDEVMMDSTSSKLAVIIIDRCNEQKNCPKSSIFPELFHLIMQNKLCVLGSVLHILARSEMQSTVERMGAHESDAIRSLQ